MQRRLLSGTYECSLDDRSRIAIPARVRDRFADGAVCAWWIDPHSVILVPRLEWPDLLDRTLGESDLLDTDARELSRYLHAGAFEQESLDKQGRVLVPGDLREHGGLDGRVRVIGVGDYLEVWDPSRLGERFSAIHEGVSDLAKRVRTTHAASRPSA